MLRTIKILGTATRVRHPSFAPVVPMSVLMSALLLAGAACGRQGEADLLPDEVAEATGVVRESEAEAEPESPSILSRLLAREPQRVDVPTGTQLEIELLDTLSSHTSQPGEPFSARVTTDVRIGDVVAVPAGAMIRGTLTEARPPRGVGGRARLTLDFRELHTDSGSLPISAALTRVGKSQAGKDAAIIGGSTIGGAILGEAIDDGDGDVIGAIVGGLAGTAAAVKTRGKPLVVEAGTVLAIELQQSVTVEVAT
jgi:hypothetical protein